uniref:Ubiquitin carboxyl-terminal hydrolase n=1 Tax=Cyclopterus lumpus TaxID=8103 RepID=A0A8C2XMN4_CYCLU
TCLLRKCLYFFVNLWACLKCSHVACGRFMEEHSLKHFQDWMCFCFACGDYVLNDNKPSLLTLSRKTPQNGRAAKLRRYYSTHAVTRRRLAPGVTGLRNLGNTCYMNSILQVLSHLQKFRECFLTLDLAPPCPQASELVQPKEPRCSTRQQMSLCHELHTLFRVMWSGRWSLVSPFAMLHSVWNLIPAFRGYDQQDAQEFLCELLDKVQQELDTEGSKRRIVIPITQRKLSKQVLKVLNTIFHGQLLSQVTCLSCKHKSNTVEPFWDLSLEFPERYHSIDKGSGSTAYQRSCTLTEMLSKFTEMEALEGSIYACNHCNKAHKQLLIYPDLSHKIGVHVAFDQVLNIKPYCCTGSGHSVHRGGYTYDLSAVVMHHGKGFGSGHYTAYCYNTEGGEEETGLDSYQTMKSCGSEVCNTQAYILFYTQRSKKAGRKKSKTFHK